METTLLQLFNTYSGKYESFSTPNDAISMYVCGITSYDYAHIGHARSAVAFDVFVRYFTMLGKDVLFIRNFTDIDDKIIARANKENTDYATISALYMNAYHEDMDKLGVLRPSVEPLATEHIDAMIAFIERLIQEGCAYTTPAGNVYYRVETFVTYGKLSGHTVESLYDGVRVENDKEKENPLDFALWKIAKDGEPFWESPWGKGRPGWHIECSAMSAKYANLPLDIHGGGRDLIFPHHENEIAQTEALCQCTFARFWVHNGFVQINAEKMSKSLSNFVTVRDIYTQYLPEVLRYFLLTKQYRNPLDFSFDTMKEAEKNLRSLYAHLLTIERFAEEHQCKCTIDTPLHKGRILKNVHPKKSIFEAHPVVEKTPHGDKSPFLQILEKENTQEQTSSSVLAEYKKYREGFFIALFDDMNTAAALGFLFPLLQHIVQTITQKSKEATSLVTLFLSEKEYYTYILGVLTQEPTIALERMKFHSLKRIQQEYPHITEEYIQNAIEERNTARKNKDFAKADAIRGELQALGIVLQDAKEGTTWDAL